MNLNFWFFGFYIPSSLITSVCHHTQFYEMLRMKSKCLWLSGKYFTNWATFHSVSWHGVDCCFPCTLALPRYRAYSGTSLLHAFICLDFYWIRSLLTSRLSQPSLPWQPPTACSLSGSLAALSLRPSVLATQFQSHLNRAWSRASLSSHVCACTSTCT